MNGRHSPECVAARATWRRRLARLLDGLSRGRRSGNGAAAQHRPERAAADAALVAHGPSARQLRAIGFAMTLAIVAAACGGGAGNGAGSGPGTGKPASGLAPGLTVETEGVVIADDVTRIDAATAKEHLQAVRDGGTLVFGGDAPEVGDLGTGDILVLDEIGVRKITSVGREGGLIVVGTEDATVAEVVTDGRLGWTYDVDFDSLPDAAYEAAMVESGLYPLTVASAGDLDPELLRALAEVKHDELRFAGKVKGFDVEFKLVPKADRLDFELSAARSNVKVQAAGFISQFVQETVMEFDGGTGTFFDASVKGLKGEAEVTWNAFQIDDPSMNQDIVALAIPLNLPIPFMAGPIPMTLNIKMNIRVVPELTGGQASSGGAWKVTYDSDQGFQTNGGDPTPRSTVRNMVANLGKEPTVTAGLGVVGFGVGVEWPRLELQLGHPIWPELYEGDDAETKSGLEKASGLLRPYAFLTTNIYVNGMWTPGTILTSDIPPCQRSSIKLSAIAGYKLSVLGMVEIADNKLLWEKQLDEFKDGKPCTLTGS